MPPVDAAIVLADVVRRPRASARSSPEFRSRSLFSSSASCAERTMSVVLFCSDQTEESTPTRAVDGAGGVHPLLPRAHQSGNVATPLSTTSRSPTPGGAGRAPCGSAGGVDRPRGADVASPRRLRTFEPGLPAVAPAERPLETEQGVRRGEITVAMLSPEEYGRQVEDLTGASVVMFMDGERIESSAAGVPADVPDEGSVMVDGDKNRVRGFTAPAVGGDVDIRLLLDEQDTASLRDGTRSSRPGGDRVPDPRAIRGRHLARLQSEIQRCRSPPKLGRGDFSSTPRRRRRQFAASGARSTDPHSSRPDRGAARDRTRLEESFRRVRVVRRRSRPLRRMSSASRRRRGHRAAAGRGAARSETTLQEVARTRRRRLLARAPRVEAAVIDAGQIFGSISAR